MTIFWKYANRCDFSQSKDSFAVALLPSSHLGHCTVSSVYRICLSSLSQKSTDQSLRLPGMKTLSWRGLVKLGKKRIEDPTIAYDVTARDKRRVPGAREG